MILKKVEGRRNPRAWHGSRLTVSGLHGHPSTPNPRPKRRVETPGDPWGVPQPPGPSSPAYGTPPTANRWFLPLSSSQWGQTLPTTSVMFPVRIEPRGHAQGGKKIPGRHKCIGKRLADEHDLGNVNVKRLSPKDVGEQIEMSALIETQNVSHCSEGQNSFKRTDASLAWAPSQK